MAYLGADYGICGEGEIAFLSLLARLQRGEDPARVQPARAVLAEDAVPVDVARLEQQGVRIDGCRVGTDAAYVTRLVAMPRKQP